MARVALISFSDDLSFGLRYIAATLRAAGHTAEVIAYKVAFEFDEPVKDEIHQPKLGTRLQTNETELRLVCDLLRELRSEIVGMTVTSPYFDLAALVADRIREVLGLPMVWGGPDVYFNPEDALGHADAVCLADGEPTMVDLVGALSAGGDGIAKVEGIGFVDEQGQLVRTARRERIGELDALPFPRRDLADTYFISQNRVWHREYHPHGILQPTVRHIITGRGCPYHCTYCCNNRTGRSIFYGTKIYRRSVGNVIDEVRQMRRESPEVDHVFIFDEVFPIASPWLDEFCARWPKEIGLPFMILTHPKVTRRKVMEELRKAGLRGITMGIQSGSERINRDIYERPTTPEEIIESGRILAENGFRYVVEIIHSNPWEETEDQKATARVLHALPKPYILGSMNPLYLWTNFDITKKAMAEGKELVRVSSHTYQAVQKPEYSHWCNVYTVTALQPMDGEALEFLLNSWEQPGGPAFVAQLAEGLRRATYRLRHPIDLTRKDEYIRDLETNLGRLTGSRLVQLSLKFRRMLDRMRSRPVTPEITLH